MYTKRDCDDLQPICYVYHECEVAAYTIDKKYRIMRETIGTKETFQPQKFLPDKWGWAMRTPDSETWCIVRYAGYFNMYDEHKKIVKCRTIEEVLQVISASAL